MCVMASTDRSTLSLFEYKFHKQSIDSQLNFSKHVYESFKHIKLDTVPYHDSPTV